MFVSVVIGRWHGSFETCQAANEARLQVCNSSGSSSALSTTTRSAGFQFFGIWSSGGKVRSTFSVLRET